MCSGEKTNPFLYVIYCSGISNWAPKPVKAASGLVLCLPSFTFSIVRIGSSRAGCEINRAGARGIASFSRKREPPPARYFLGFLQMGPLRKAKSETNEHLVVKRLLLRLPSPPEWILSNWLCSQELPRCLPPAHTTPRCRPPHSLSYA